MPHPHLLALIDVTETMFHCPKGSLIADDRSEPLVSFRKLAYKVARDRGFTYAAIADAFKVEPGTPRVIDSRLYLKMRAFPWWSHAKADLIDAWDEAIDALGETDDARAA